ncbi:MAG: tyrosine-type recombinase/integrase [Actinomycetota bacterium]|nr:tyrosine-type recombinase/integrase [Actinomycetota bacterium]
MWLSKQPLAEHTRRTYRTRVAQFLDWLSRHGCEAGDPLADPHARDYAVRDYKRHLKAQRKLAASTVNLSLAAIDHFYRHLGLEAAGVRREDLPSLSPRALDEEEQRRLLRAVERRGDVRDAAIVMLGLYAGLRLSELAALEVDDVAVSARKGEVTIRSGKGAAMRQVPLNAQSRVAVQAWLGERATRHPQVETAALLVSGRGRRLSTRAIDLVVRRLGKEAGLELSVHVLRHTCLTRLVRGGVDLVTVAELAGHQRLETTRRYTCPQRRTARPPWKPSTSTIDLGRAVRAQRWVAVVGGASARVGTSAGPGGRSGRVFTRAQAQASGC